LASPACGTAALAGPAALTLLASAFGEVADDSRAHPRVAAVNPAMSRRAKSECRIISGLLVGWARAAQGST
jgi:hypothetical protein